MRRMTALTPSPTELRSVTETLATWQRDVGALQLHPGDIGWFSMRGADRTAECLRVWTRHGTPVAVGLLDGDDLLRLALDAASTADEDLAREMAADITNPDAEILGDGEVTVEARGLDLLNAQLRQRGWQLDEPWTPLHLDLTQDVERSELDDSGLRVVEVGPDRFGDWGRVHWSAFRGTPFGAEERAQITGWLQTMVDGPLGDRLTLVGALDRTEEMVAIAGIWTAGVGRPGLLEPMGVHADHQGKGYGVSICQAAAVALRDRGSSSALVCAESSNRGAVATYLSAGFSAAPEVHDLARR